MARRSSRWTGIPLVGLRFSNTMGPGDYRAEGYQASEVEPVEIWGRRRKTAGWPWRSRFKAEKLSLSLQLTV
jgi:nucleoside-diphosphate-sugar epimerase